MDAALATLAEVPTELADAGDIATSRVQVAKTGSFYDPRYGKFDITAKDFDAWQRNFVKLHIAEGKLGVPVDVDHSPSKEGKTEAAGWVVALDRNGPDGRTPSPTQLWGVVEWNSLGQELVRDRRYAYLSPEFHPSYAGEQGQNVGKTLLGVALTNRPFLRTGMATVSLSESTFAVPTSDSPPTMPLTLTETTIKALGLDADATEDAVIAAFNARTATPDPATINLAEAASAQGKVVLDAEAVAKMAADATAGAAAAATLKEQRFSLAWADAVQNGRMLPANEETYKALYEARPDDTVKILTESPVVLNHTPAGHGGGHNSGVALDAETRRELNGESFEGPDDDTQRIHSRALAIVAERNIDYAEAALLAEAEGSVA